MDHSDSSSSSASPFLWSLSEKKYSHLNSYIEPNPSTTPSRFFKQTNNSLIYSTLLPREILQKAPRRRWFTKSSALCDVVASRLPFTLRKSSVIEFNGKDICDKIFASCWIDSSRIAMGTKDNQLIIWDSDTGNRESISLPTSTTPLPRDICGIHDIDTNPSSSLLVSGGKNPHDLQIFSLPSVTPTLLLQGHKNWVFASKFISEDVVVSGCRAGKILVWNVSQASENANNAREESVIKDLESLGVENSDTMDEDVVMEQATEGEVVDDNNNNNNNDDNNDNSDNNDSNNSDSSNNNDDDDGNNDNNNNNDDDDNDINNINNENNESEGGAMQAQEERKPIAVRSEHTKKVRDIQYGRWTKQFYTLSADATVKIWDTNSLSVVNTIPLTERNELVCMAAHNQTPIIAVGSQRKVTIIDTRQEGGSDSVVLDNVDSKDGEWGVRSVRFYGHILSVGGGMGSLSFYDMRAQRYLGVTKQGTLQVGEGWSVKNDNYWNMDAYSYKHAIYTHSWDPSRTKLFVGGGPIMMGLAGGYASVW